MKDIESPSALVQEEHVNQTARGERAGNVPNKPRAASRDEEDVKLRPICHEGGPELDEGVDDQSPEHGGHAAHYAGDAVEGEHAYDDADLG